MMDDQAGTDWTTYAKIVAIFAGAIGLLVLFGAAGRGKVQDQGVDGTWLVIWSSFMLLGGVMAFRTGFQRYRERQLIRDTPTSKVRSIAVGDVEIKGTAHPVDEPLTSPLTEEDVCIWEIEIEEKKSAEEGSTWNTVLETGDHVPFHLDDGTGRVQVDPQEADLAIEDEAEIALDSGEEPPERLATWTEAQDWWTKLGAEDAEDGNDGGIGERMQRKMVERAKEHLTEPQDRKRRLTERTLHVGEETYVFGGARPREDQASPNNPENLVIGVHDGTGKLMITDQGEAAFAEEKLVTTAVVLAAALAFIPMGVWGILVGLGLL